MAFGKSFISGLGSSLANNAISTGINWLSTKLGLTMSQEEAMEKQWQYNQKIMALQNQYNQQAAEQGQQYAKEYWDYTNAENQKQHLINAGLNPALMYGQSGAGGMGATGGSRQEGVDQAQGNPVGMALQIQQMEQQKKLQDAQIAATYAQANKDNAAAGEHEQNINESIQKVENLIKEGDLTESTNELRKIEIEIARKTNEIKDWEIVTEQGLGMKYRAEAEEAAMTAKMNYEKARKENIDYQIAFNTYDTLVKRATLLNFEIEARTKWFKEQAKLPEGQLEVWGAEVQELQARALKENWDRETYRKEVEGMCKRWQQQTINERWHLTNESVETIIDGIISFGKKFLSKKK
nr:MAG TPA: hypothetical protein [Microviridae sp.]